MKKGAARLAGGILVTCIVILFLTWIANRGSTPPAVAASTSDYEQQMAALDTAYSRGTTARKMMKKHRIAPTSFRCTSMYRATVASELGNPEFEAEVEQFYLAGCLAKKLP